MSCNDACMNCRKPKTYKVLTCFPQNRKVLEDLIGFAVRQNKNGVPTENSV